MKAWMLAIALVLVAGPRADARKLPEPGTGLRGIAFGHAAPDFTYDDGDGLRSLSQLPGRVVIVHFWASWCKPCLAELPWFDRLAASGPSQVTVVTLPWHEPLETARSFVRQRGYRFAVAADPDEGIARAYGVEKIPVTVVLRADRTVSYVSLGAATWDELTGAAISAMAPLGTVSVDPSSRL